MIVLSRKEQRKPFLIFGLRSVVSILIYSLVFSPAISYAQQASVLGLPKPGTMVSLSSSYVPVIVKGLRVHPENPILFDFIVDTGDSGFGFDSARLRSESEKLIKYFLASLTIPEEDLWVNLSPYEKDRIIPQQLGQTFMGRDMLAQDYILKQLTASLIYPDKNLGKEFWNKVYTKAQNLFGSSEIPVNTFNKVWIVADKAKVYVHDNTAFVVACHMKVMLEEDYLAMYKHGQARAVKSANAIGSQVVREVVLPELEKEVNQGKNFANLRQIFNSMILAAWYKKSLKEAFLNQVYSNKAKIRGIDVRDKTIKEQIYQEYLQAYKKGVFNYIKEDIQTNGQTVARKYFSGGIVGSLATVEQEVMLGDPDARESMQKDREDGAAGKVFSERVTVAPPGVVQSFAPVYDDGEESANSAMITEAGFKLGLALFSSYVKKNANITSSKLIELDDLERDDEIIRGKTGLSFKDQKSFKKAILSAVEWGNISNAGHGQETTPPIVVKGIVVIDRKKGIDPYEEIKLDKIRDEMGGFYFQDGVLYVLKSFLKEGFESARRIDSTDILSSHIVMAIMEDPIPLDKPDDLFRAEMDKLEAKQDADDNFETDRQELIDELKQRRHRENMVKAYGHVFDYLESRTGTKIAFDAKSYRRQLQVEKRRIMDLLPGTYLQGLEGAENEERAKLQKVLESYGVGHVQLQGQNAASIDKVTFYALTGEVDTLLSYCGYQRALNIMAEKINPRNTMNADEKNLEKSLSNGKRTSILVWGSALNPLTIAHILIVLEEMRQADSGYLLLTEGDFRKAALLHSAPARREMVTELRADLFRGNQITDLRVMLEPEARTKDEQKYHPNTEEKVMGVARLNPNSDIHYGFGTDHYKAILGRGRLDENNVRDFVYYMAMSGYVRLLKQIQEWSSGGTVQEPYEHADADINSVIKLLQEAGLEGKDFDQRREVLLGFLLKKIKTEEIRVPILDSIPKLVLINTELEAEGIATRVGAVIALRGGVAIKYDPIRDKIIEKYKLKVTINDGVTSDISSTDVRQAIVQFALTGGVDPFKLGAVPIPEWQFLFGDEFKDYQNFLLRFEGPVLPAIPKLLAERRNAKKGQEKAPESIALQKAWNASGLRADYEVGSPDPPTPDLHTSFEITKKARGAKGANGQPNIRVNYSVKCGLDRASGDDVTVFNTFSITFSSDDFSDEQKEMIKHIIYTQIRDANHITAGTIETKEFGADEQKELGAAVIQRLIDGGVVSRISDEAVRINEGLDLKEGLKSKIGLVGEIVETLMGDVDAKDKKQEVDRIWGILEKADKTLFNVTVIDAAMNTPENRISQARQVQGGIDLNSRNLQMDIGGETIDLKFDPAMAAQFEREDFSGVEPIIIQITSVYNPLELLGVNPGIEEEALVKV